LEAALVVGIILAYLKQVKSTQFNNIVYMGIVSGGLFACVTAYIFQEYLGGFEGPKEELFEGVVMLVASGLITSMILWMRQQSRVAGQLQKKVHGHIESQHPFGLFLLTSLAVGREGVETVIFLNASRFWVW
jgi:high-affinity iron transporter